MRGPRRGLSLHRAKSISHFFNDPHVHFMRKVLAHAGKSGRRVASAFIATAFAQDDSEAARAQWRRTADQLRPKLPKLPAFLDEAATDVRPMSFPAAHRAKLHSTDEMDKRFLTAPR